MTINVETIEIIVSTESVQTISLSDADQGPVGPQGPAGPQGIQGIQGAVGPTGPAGATGAQGIQGEQGPQGAAGVDASVFRNGTGAPSNSLGDNLDYYVDTNTGDYYQKTSGTYAVIGNIRGPAGANGADGAAGATGPQGAQGPQGIQGATGATGPAGADGVMGSVWTTGTGVPSDLVGTNNDYYLDTSNGDVYKKAAGVYSVILNLTGPAGATGPQGPAGEAGVIGSIWRDGTGAPSNFLGVDSDFYLNTDNGDVYKKTSGTYSVVANIKGPAGAAGAAGATGATGPAGADGAQGPQGIQGIQGPAGADGAAGATGPQGPAGTNGTNGTNGADGATWTSGDGAPSNGTGVNGDYYLNVTNGDVYKKATGTYSVVGNIKGADGAGGTGGGLTMALAGSTQGLVPRLVTSFKLKAGTYALSVSLGSSSNYSTAYAVLKNGSTTIKTVSQYGRVAWVDAVTPFTLATDSDLDLYIYNNNRSAYTYARGLQIS